MKSNSTQKKILVAIQFDDLSAHLLSAAAELATQIDGSVHAVHVCELTNPVAWSYATGGGFGLENLATMVEDQQVETAREKMRNFIKQMETPTKFTSEVLTGNPAQIIAAEATAKNATLILTGANPGSHRFIPKGLSTALSLMGHANTPVMVMAAGCKLNFSKEPFRILVADDLRETSLPALKLVTALAAMIPTAEIMQVHVNGLTRDTLISGLETAAATSHSAPITIGTVEEIFTMMMHNIESKMEERMNSVTSKSLSRTSPDIRRTVRTGPVNEEMQKVLADYPADLLVYGRHQTFHHKPFSVGQVPFHSILSLHRPVVITPAENA